jgi:hypothetical protein
MKNVFKIFILLTVASISCQTRTKPKSAYEILKSASDNVNMKCPIQIDSILKLENTLAFPIATFRYNLTLKYDTVKYDIHEFENTLRATTLNMAKTNPDGKMFKDLYTTLEYNFSDTLGNFLFRFVFNPEEYR